MQNSKPQVKALTVMQAKLGDQPASPSRRRLIQNLSAAAATVAAVGTASSAAAIQLCLPEDSRQPLLGPPSIRTADVSPNLGVTFPFQDPMTDLKAVFQIGLAFAPEPFGALLNVFLDLIFPAFGSSQSVWDSIKAQVDAEIDKAIQQAKINAETQNMETVLGYAPVPGGFVALLNRLQDTINGCPQNPSSCQGTGPDTTSDLVSQIQTQFVQQSGQFQPGDGATPGQPLPAVDTDKPMPDAIQLLPLFVQFANLHILFLRDQINAGAKYGLTQTVINSCLADLRGVINGTTDKPSYLAYVDAQMALAHSWLETNYQRQRPVVQRQKAGDNYHGYSANGAWLAKQIQNNTLTFLEHTVMDFRHMWDHILDGNGNVITNPPQLLLTREVYLGPYGIPDLEDPYPFIDMPWQYQGTSWPPGSGALGILAALPPELLPSVPPPQSAENQLPLTYISVAKLNYNKGGRNWQLPYNSILVTRQGQPFNLYPNSFGISLATQYGGNVIGVKVDLDQYTSRDQSGQFSGMPCATGYLVAEFYFTQEDGSVHAVGYDDVAYEFKNATGYVLTVPKDHILSGITGDDGGYQLFTNVGLDPDKGLIVGSVTFGFKLRDPNLKISTSLLQTAYVTSPTDITIADLVSLVQNAYQALGLDPAELAVLEDELNAAAQWREWDALRVEYRQRKATLAAQAG
jgi:hypothetical protein